MAAIPHYDIGRLWKPQATFTVGGTPTDPTLLTVRQQNAAGVETILLNGVSPGTLNAGSTPVAKTSTGVFVLNPGITLDAAGYWFVRFEGTGAAAAAEEHQAIVDPSEFTLDGGVSTRALVGLAETKDWLQQRNIDTSNDLEIVRVINDISDRIHQEAGREFKAYGTNPATRTFVWDKPRRAGSYVVIDGEVIRDRNMWNRIVPIGDLTSTPTQVQILDTNWTTVLETVSAGNITTYPTVRQSWEPITSLEFQTGVTSLSYGMRVAVTGTWGFPAVPGDIRQAALDAIAAVLDRDVEHYAQDLGAAVGNEAGTVVLVGGGRQRLLTLPPAAAAACWRYRTPTVG